MRECAPRLAPVSSRTTECQVLMYIFCVIKSYAFTFRTARSRPRQLLQRLDHDDAVAADDNHANIILLAGHRLCRGARKKRYKRRVG